VNILFAGDFFRTDLGWLWFFNHHGHQIDDGCELELIQSHMAQKPVLRGEVGCACVAREVSVEKGGMGERLGRCRW